MADVLDSDSVERISVKGGECVVFVGHDLLRAVAADVLRVAPASKYVCITDDAVQRLHYPALEAAFATLGVELEVHSVPNGENAKSRSEKARIEDWMLGMACNRGTTMIALGGGVVGDLCGYVAATYMRGVPFVQIPTSVLAMVDASVGGKTAINVPAGKNLIGAFYQPRRVYADLTLIQTLPPRQISNGLAECIKMGVIRDAALFQLLEANPDEIQELEPGLIQQVVSQSIRLKAEVVTQDEKESGLRAILNWGHTVGHAVEGLTAPGMLHGECVAIGCVIEAELARDLGHLAPQVVGRVLRCLKSYSLPTVVPPHLAVDDLMKKMAVDKKNKGSDIRVTIVTGIGSSIPEPVAVEKRKIRLLLSTAVTVIPNAASAPPATITVPGSKSISNRVLFLAALGAGQCKIRGLLHSDDTTVMLESLARLGAGPFEWQENGEVLCVTGSSGARNLSAPSSPEPLYVGNAGTASRFLSTLCATIKSEGGQTSLGGDKRMGERPVGDLVDCLAACGCSIQYLAAVGSLPITVSATGLRGGLIELAAGTSSQFVSSVLLSAPFAEEPVTLALKGKPVSVPYTAMTASMMAQFGLDVGIEGDCTRYSIPSGGYTNPAEYQVEPDASSATYPLAVAAITGREITAQHIGSASLQGDADFCFLLERMGCSVTRGESITTVRGPESGTRLKAVDQDMSSMTDAFMTAAILMAVAEGTSQITSIANQRVKECDRIAAMVAELGKCGVVCRELPTGIEIEGRPAAELSGADIFCYKDHRIAMSFAVLGCLVPDVRIMDRKCVEKTYPDFWSDLDRKLGIACHAVEVQSLPQPENTPRPAVVLVGMRAAGKTTLGQAAAATHGMPFVDLDDVLEQRVGVQIPEYVEKNGWAAFRQQEEEVLKAALTGEAGCDGAIVACGGGVVQSDGCMVALQDCAQVIFVDRHIDDVAELLETDSYRPGLGEHPRDIYKRRLPMYEASSDYRFSVCKGDGDWDAIGRDFSRLVGFVLGRCNSVYIGPDSFFLSLTFPDLAQCTALLPQIAKGVDALELRADLLAQSDAAFVRDQIAILRRHTALPIVFTVRSRATQGGQFEGTEAEYFAALRVGQQSGCEFIDVEACWSEASIGSFYAIAGAHKIIGSYHDFDKYPSTPELLQLFKRCARGGKSHVAKVIVAATEQRHCWMIHEHARQAALGIPHIAMCVSDLGSHSRVLNSVLTPVTHPLLPDKAAPGQLSAKEILESRSTSHMLAPGKRFFIFGHPVGRSPSPCMHNAAFHCRGLPHRYGLFDTVDAREVQMTLACASFGGASVTIPFKTTVLPWVDVKSEAVAAIGAANTLTRGADGRLYGDNTDWAGIKALLDGNVRTVAEPASTALVVGAGGTARAACYALKQMAFEHVLVLNRSAEKAEALAAEFGCLAVDEATVAALQRLDAVVGTVPASAGFELPPGVAERCKPVVLDAAYLPRETALLKQAAAAGCVALEGVEMLFEQGCLQAQIWGGRPAPRREIAAALLRTFYAGLPAAEQPKTLAREAARSVNVTWTGSRQ